MTKPLKKIPWLKVSERIHAICLASTYLRTDEGDVPDLAGRYEEVVLRTEYVLAQVVYLDKVRRDESQCGLGARQPDGSDDEVPGL